MIDSRPFHVHREFKDMVTCLSGGNVSCIKIGTNLIMAFSLDDGTIWTLVGILVNIFHCLDRAIDFQVDMIVKQYQELSGMRNHMSIIKDILMLLNSSTIVRVSIIRIAILLDDSLWSVGLWKTLFADIVLKTSVRRARTMKHVFGNSRVKLWMKIGIWYLC